MNTKTKLSPFMFLAAITCIIFGFTSNHSGSKGMMEIKKEKPPKAVDLSAEGTLDWVHWGYITGTSIENKKSSSKIKISNLAKIGDAELHTYANNATGYSWTDGAPSAKVATNSGIFIGGKGFGYELSVPADEKTRTLKVYTGVWACKAQFEAKMSDGSVPDYINTDLISTGNQEVDIINAVYIIKYKASSPGQKLTVKITTAVNGGNVELQAATLSE